MNPSRHLFVVATLATLILPAGAAQAPREPHATMQDRTLTLHPTETTFQLPDELFTDTSVRGFTSYLSRSELMRVQTVDASTWDYPYSLILNAGFPFDACAAHLGTEPFGPGSRSFGDLQIRVYVIDGPAKPIREGAVQKAYEEARRVFPAKKIFPEAALSQLDPVHDWTASRIAYMRDGGDFAAGVNLDFYIKEFDKQSVVFAFVYPPQPTRPSVVRRPSWEATIARIINSASVLATLGRPAEISPRTSGKRLSGTPLP